MEINEGTINKIEGIGKVPIEDVLSVTEVRDNHIDLGAVHEEGRVNVTCRLAIGRRHDRTERAN